MIRELLCVGAGGAVGSMVRYLLSGNLLAGCFLSGFPAGTFAVNALGSLLIGLVTGAVGESAWLMRLLAVGFCGGFTTFSAFSADTVRLLREGHYTPALLYIGSSVVVCVITAAAGMWIGESVRN